MCGIAGVLGDNLIHDEVSNKFIDALTHRGPDSNGSWISQEDRVLLAHTRLSIQDLSENGNQPMVSSTGRFIISFNGEVYNHYELRSKVETIKGGIPWKGTSDTETIIELCEIYKIVDVFKMITGMFALSIWDKKLKKLYLARDKMGEKPLYYGISNGIFIFASELKAVRSHPSFNNSINRDAIATFMKYGKIPSTKSIYTNIKKLLPGNYLEIDIDKIEESMKPKSYWSYLEMINKSKDNMFSGNDTEAINMLEKYISDAIGKQQISDVEIGAFLSGGIDSSIIVSLMQKNSIKKIKTFTIGTEDADYDESNVAREVSKIIGTDHNELIINSKDILDTACNIANIYDEPFADSSQIPTFLVSKLARKKVKVCMSGDGGDEIFGGYNRYTWAANFSKYPYNLRVAMNYLLSQFSETTMDNFNNFLKPLLPNKFKINNFGEKIKKAEKILNLHEVSEIYDALISTDGYDSSIAIKGNNNYNVKKLFRDFEDHNIYQKIMYVDAVSYLPDDILCKVDRAAMSVSLETRVPFLDVDLMAFSSRLPRKFLLRNGERKWILRQILKKYIPKRIIDRPKSGFAVPVGDWLKGPLKSWALDLLSEDLIKKQGYLNHDFVNKTIKEHLSGSHNRSYMIWNMLMFQSWLKGQNA